MSKLQRSNDYSAEFDGFDIEIQKTDDMMSAKFATWEWEVTIESLRNVFADELLFEADDAYAAALRAVVAACESMAAQARAELAEVGEDEV